MSEIVSQPVVVFDLGITLFHRCNCVMVIAIVGLGYVGLPLALRFAQSGLEVFGLDVSEEKVEQLQAGRSYIRHISNESVASAVKADRFRASTDFSEIANCDAILICVPTPLDNYRNPDLSYVLKTGASIAPFLSPRQGIKKLVVLESTTFPGTTERELREVLESGSGLQGGKDFHLAFSPEREDPGRTDCSLRTIPKIVGGMTDDCRQRAVELYSKAIDTVFPVSSCSVAEAAKLTENIFRSVNIALVNELKVVYDAIGVDIWEVIEAAKTKPFGFMAFYPGPGLGGHCIPIDPYYLTWRAREYDQYTRFIELAGEVNTRMPDYVVKKVGDSLNSRRQSINGAKILLLGLAYKPNVDDCRESPSFVLWRKLEQLGAEVSFNDPYVQQVPPKREFMEYAGRTSVEITADYDLILICTHHAEYSQIDFSTFPCVLVDTRNCVANERRPQDYVKA